MPRQWKRSRGSRSLCRLLKTHSRMDTSPLMVMAIKLTCTWLREVLLIPTSSRFQWLKRELSCIEIGPKCMILIIFRILVQAFLSRTLSKCKRNLKKWTNYPTSLSIRMKSLILTMKIASMKVARPLDN